MNKKLMTIALWGMGIGIGLGAPGGARADVAGGKAALEAGRCTGAVKELMPAARAGDPAAQNILGDIYSGRPKCALLDQAGWQELTRAKALLASLPQTDKAADLALRPTLVGHYSMSGEREAAAELLLRANGKFEYSMSYGAQDESAQGTWKVWNKQVVFRSDAVPASQGALRPSSDAPAVTVPEHRLLVDVRYKHKSQRGFHVMVLGDAPLQATGDTGDKGWNTAFSGPVRLVGIRHEHFNNDEWLTYEVPPAHALHRSYQLDIPEPATTMPTAFNFTLQVRNGALLWDREGRDVLFEKE